MTFDLSSLASMFEKCSQASLGFGVGEAGPEQIVFGEEPLERVRQRGIHGCLGTSNRSGRETRDSGRQSFDERSQLIIGQSSVHVAPVDGGLTTGHFYREQHPKSEGLRHLQQPKS